uniref:OTU domain-containing protein n=1 Tax=Acrobeloides nanus TaxID=290746 RepID=A0A914DNL9_9BILA
MQIEFIASQRGDQPITPHPTDPTLCYTWSLSGGAKTLADGRTRRTYGCTACRALQAKDRSITVPKLIALDKTWDKDPSSLQLKHSCVPRNRKELMDNKKKSKRKTVIEDCEESTVEPDISIALDTNPAIPSTSKTIDNPCNTQQENCSIIEDFDVDAFFASIAQTAISIFPSMQGKLPPINTLLNRQTEDYLPDPNIPSSSKTNLMDFRHNDQSILSNVSNSNEGNLFHQNEDLFTKLCRAFSLENCENLQEIKQKFEKSINAKSDNLVKLRTFLELFLSEAKKDMLSPGHSFHLLNSYAKTWSRHLNGTIESSTEIASNLDEITTFTKFGLDYWKESLGDTLIEVCKTIEILYKVAEKTEKDFTSYIQPDHPNSLVMLDVINTPVPKNDKMLIKKEGQMSSVDWYLFFKAVNEYLQSIGQLPIVEDDLVLEEPDVDYEDLHLEDIDLTLELEELKALEKRKEELTEMIKKLEERKSILNEKYGEYGEKIKDYRGDVDLRDFELIDIDCQSVSDEDAEIIHVNVISTPKKYIKFPTLLWKFQACEKMFSHGVRIKAFVPQEEPEHLFSKKTFDLDLNSMRYIDISHDGNNGFRALSWTLLGDERFHVFVRQAICLHLMIEESFVKTLVNKQYSNKTGYIADSQMLNNNVWITNVELHAAAHLFGMHILVYEAENEPMIDPNMPHFYDYAYVDGVDDSSLDLANVTYDEKKFDYKKGQFENDRKYGYFKKEPPDHGESVIEDNKSKEFAENPPWDWNELSYDVRHVTWDELWSKSKSSLEDTEMIQVGQPDEKFLEETCKGSWVFMSEDVSIPKELEVTKNFKARHLRLNICGSTFAALTFAAPTFVAPTFAAQK